MDIAAAVIRAREGDQEALAFLYTQTSGKAYYLARQLLRDDDQVQDVLQDAYVKAFQSLHMLGDPNKFQGWIDSIVINRSKDYLKKRKPILFSQMVGEGEADAEPDFEDESEQFSPEAVVDYRETKRLVQEMIDSLPQEQRMTIVLHYLEEIPVKEIARIMECSEGTVKSRLNYGRKAIKDKVLELEKKGTKLYCVPLVPFLCWMFHQEAQAAVAPYAFGEICAEAVVGGTAEASAASAAGGIAVGIKAIAVVAAVAIAAVGVGGYAFVTRNRQDDRRIENAYEGNGSERDSEGYADAHGEGSSDGAAEKGHSAGEGNLAAENSPSGEGVSSGEVSPAGEGNLAAESSPLGDGGSSDDGSSSGEASPSGKGGLHGEADPSGESTLSGEGGSERESTPAEEPIFEEPEFAYGWDRYFTYSREQLQAEFHESLLDTTEGIVVTTTYAYTTQENDYTADMVYDSTGNWGEYALDSLRSDALDSEETVFITYRTGGIPGAGLSLAGEVQVYVKVDQVIENLTDDLTVGQLGLKCVPMSGFENYVEGEMYQLAVLIPKEGVSEITYFQDAYAEGNVALFVEQDDGTITVDMHEPCIVNDVDEDDLLNIIRENVDDYETLCQMLNKYISSKTINREAYFHIRKN